MPWPPYALRGWRAGPLDHSWKGRIAPGQVCHEPVAGIDFFRPFSSWAAVQRRNFRKRTTRFSTARKRAKSGRNIVKFPAFPEGWRWRGRRVLPLCGMSTYSMNRHHSLKSSGIAIVLPLLESTGLAADPETGRWTFSEALRRTEQDTLEGTRPLDLHIRAVERRQPASRRLPTFKLPNSYENSSLPLYRFSPVPSRRFVRGRAAPQHHYHDGGRHGLRRAELRPLRQPQISDPRHGPARRRGVEFHRLPCLWNGLLTHPRRPAHRTLPATGRHRGCDSSAQRSSRAPQGLEKVRDYLRRTLQAGRLRHRHRRQVAPRLS